MQKHRLFVVDAVGHSVLSPLMGIPCRCVQQRGVVMVHSEVINKTSNYFVSHIIRIQKNPAAAPLRAMSRIIRIQKNPAEAPLRAMYPS